MESYTGLNYNNSHHSLNSSPHDSAKPITDIGVEVASKYIGRGSEPCNLKGSKSIHYSSDDDSDTEFSSMSLMALAAKHKNKTTLTSEKKNSTISPQFVLPSTLGKSGHADSSDSSSETEGLTLVDLMKKNTIKDTCVVDGSIDSKLKNLKVEEITTKFVSANFSDDSDCDEPVSLMGLAMKHAQSVNVEGTGSADDVRCPRPSVKTLQILTSYHRQHTKSESDRYSAGTAHPSDSLVKKRQEDNVSTSLKNLRGGGYSDMEFQFSPGGSIPGSFKSLNAGHSLNSSLTSVDAGSNSKLGSFTGIYDYDSDSRIETPNIWHQAVIHEPKLVESRDCYKVNVCEEGINLSCALKKSTSDILMLEDNNENIADAEDDEIITLLDSMPVDEEMVEEGKVKNRLVSNSEDDESCSIDVSHVLKLKIKLRTRKCTSFGKVVCRKWRSLRSPCIKKDKRRTSVIPFNFVEPSPDDRIAYAFKRRL